MSFAPLKGSEEEKVKIEPESSTENSPQKLLIQPEEDTPLVMESSDTDLSDKFHHLLRKP